MFFCPVALDCCFECSLSVGYNIPTLLTDLSVNSPESLLCVVTLTTTSAKKGTGYFDVRLSHPHGPYERRRSPTLKTRHHLIKITLPPVDELRRERGIVVPGQIEGASKLQLYQIRGSEPNQSRRNTTDRRRRGWGQGGDKTGGTESAGGIHRSDQDQFIRAR